MKHPYSSLDEALQDIWQRLKRGSADGRHPFHTPVMGTTGPHGPELRTVVLRGWHPNRRELVIHTDPRSGKMRDLARHPQVSWLFYHPQDRLQLRLQGTAEVLESGPRWQHEWERTAPRSRGVYRLVQAPGQATTQTQWPLPDGHEAAEPENFAVVITAITTLDMLWLHRSGHQRAWFDWRNGFQASWSTP